MEPVNFCALWIIQSYQNLIYLYCTGKKRNLRDEYVEMWENKTKTAK